MISRAVLVDSNLIFDVVESDPVWSSWAQRVLSTYAPKFINPIIFAELCYRRGSVHEVELMLEDFETAYSEMPREALYLASQAYKKYKQRGGAKLAPLPDFFIGAHAQAAGWALLTRDAKRYRTYFPEVMIISPESAS
jgi:predicted nucleic acid-binding protein